MKRTARLLEAVRRHLYAQGLRGVALADAMIAYLRPKYVTDERWETMQRNIRLVVK